MKQFVYFLQREGTRRIKIGKSSDPARRIRQLRTGSDERINFLGVMDPDAGWDESALHDEFQRHRVCGEWFEPDIALRTFVDVHAIEWDGLSLVPPFPPFGIAIPTRVVPWKRLPVIDFDAIRDGLRASS